MAEKFSHFVLNNRKLFIFLILFYTLFMGYKGLEVEYNYDFSQTVPDTDEEMIYYNSFKNTFGEDGNVFAIGLKDSSIFEVEKFKLYNDYVTKVENIYGVKGALGLPRLQALKKNNEKKNFDFINIFDPFPNSQNEYDSLLNQVKNEGAEIIITDKLDELFKIAKKLVDEEQRTFIHPFEGLSTSLGTAGIGLEFVKSIPTLDAVIVSIGGGGLISGVASAIKQVNENCKIFGVEPKGAATMLKSFSTGKPIKNVTIDSEVDSLSPPMTLPFSYAVCKKYIDEIVTVSDEEIFASMVILQEESKLAVEPAAAATLSAYIGPLKHKLKNKNVGLLMCGANIDHKSYSDLLLKGQSYINKNQSIF